MLYILMHNLAKIRVDVTIEKSVGGGGTKSSVSVSDEKVQANQDRVYF